MIAAKPVNNIEGNSGNTYCISSSMKDNNTSNLRFKEMKETFRLIKPEMKVMEKLLSKYQLFEQDDLSAYCFELLNRRWKKNILPQRAYFLRKIYEYILWEQGVEKLDAQLEQLFKVKLGFIMEVTIVIQYLHNQIIDEKFDVKKPKEIRRNLIASNILREILFQYIEQEISNYGREIYDKTRLCISEILLHVDLGQRLEQEYNHYDSYQKNPPLSISESPIALFSDLDCIRPIIASVKKDIPQKIDFIESYFRRIYLTNGCFYTFMTRLVMDVLEYKDESKKEDLSNFAVIFGVANQITNDIVDFVPPIKNNKSKKNLSSNTVGKKTTDSYSDLKNRNITLPLIYHLSKHQQRLIENYLSKPTNPKSIDKYSLEITKEILKSRAIQKAKKIGKYIANLADNHLNIKNPSSCLIMNIIERTKWNKYYYELNKITN